METIEQSIWDFRGLDRSDPNCLHSPEETVQKIRELGFLPLFPNEVTGFSLAELTWGGGWWTDSPDVDPWLWREEIARSAEVAYGKFFRGRAGFVSLDWLPVFANYRRDGYDFDARFDDGKAKHRAKKIMDLFSEADELASWEVRQLAGFGRGGEKNFTGILTELEMQFYLVAKDFRRRINARGETYGWAVEILAPPERIWGYERVSAGYAEKPEASRDRILRRVRELFPRADEKSVQKLCR